MSDRRRLPGQGSQTPGFLAPWLAEPALAERLAAYSDAAGVDLVAHGTVSDADTHPRHRGRPAAHRRGGPPHAGAPARRRPRASASAASPATRSARSPLRRRAGILDRGGRAALRRRARPCDGGCRGARADRHERRHRRRRGTRCSPASTELDLEPANYNGGGQIVVAGALDALAALTAEPPAGARVIPLQVAGAFHTRYMAPAVERLAAVAAALTPCRPDAAALDQPRRQRASTSGAAFLDLLVGQVSSPVRWDLLHGVLRRGRRHRHHRARARRHPRRPRQARRSRACPRSP